MEWLDVMETPQIKLFSLSLCLSVIATKGEFFLHKEIFSTKKISEKAEHGVLLIKLHGHFFGKS